MQRVVELDILYMYPLDRFILVIVLPDAAKGNPEAVVEPRVCYANVRAIGFHRQAVVSVVHGPVVELDM